MSNNYAICILSNHGESDAEGYIKLKQLWRKNHFGHYQPSGVRFVIRLSGLQPGLHGFHCHEYGDISRGCESMGAHYNPTEKSHGGLNDPNAHLGDFGNVEADQNGEVNTTILARFLTLEEIIGRGLVVHQDRDDLGRGRNLESTKTGNAGKRVLCGIIGIAP